MIITINQNVTYNESEKRLFTLCGFFLFMKYLFPAHLILLKGLCSTFHCHHLSEVYINYYSMLIN